MKQSTVADDFNFAFSGSLVWEDKQGVFTVYLSRGTDLTCNVEPDWFHTVRNPPPKTRKCHITHQTWQLYTCSKSDKRSSHKSNCVYGDYWNYWKFCL